MRYRTGCRPYLCPTRTLHTYVHIHTLLVYLPCSTHMEVGYLLFGPLSRKSGATKVLRSRAASPCVCGRPELGTSRQLQLDQLRKAYRGVIATLSQQRPIQYQVLPVGVEGATDYPWYFFHSAKTALLIAAIPGPTHHRPFRSAHTHRF